MQTNPIALQGIAPTTGPNQQSAAAFVEKLLAADDHVFFASVYNLLVKNPDAAAWGELFKTTPGSDKLLERIKVGMITPLNKSFFGPAASDKSHDVQPLNDMELSRLVDEDLDKIMRRHDIMHGRSIWGREPSRYIRALVTAVRNFRSLG